MFDQDLLLGMIYFIPGLFFAGASLTGTLREGVPAHYIVYSVVRMAFLWPVFVLWFGLKTTVMTALEIYQDRV